MSINTNNNSELKLIYPNGQETIRDNYINIQWQETGFDSNDPYLIDPYDPPALTELEGYWYELLFTPDFINDRDEDQAWIQIASVPAFGKVQDFGLRSYIWNIPGLYHSLNCRIGVRARYRDGTRTGIDYSNANFSIVRSKVYPPSIVSPISNYNYTSSVPISITYNYEGNYMQRNLCDVYIRSEKAEMSWTLIYKNLSIYNNNVYYDTKNLLPSNDYEFKFVIHDDIDSMSNFVLIDNVSIRPVNQIYIDSKAPIGKIDVESNSIYSNSRNITLTLDSYDEGTSVKGVKIFSDADPYYYIEEPISNTKTFVLPDVSGEQKIEAQFFDYAGNTLDDSINSYGLVKSDKGSTLSPTAFYYDKQENFTIISDNEITFSVKIIDNSGFSVPTDPYSISLTIKEATSGTVVASDVTTELSKDSTGNYSYNLKIDFGVTYIAIWTYKINDSDTAKEIYQSYGPYASTQDTDIDDIYVAYGGSTPKLYKDNIFVVDLDDVCTYIYNYKDTIYLGLRKQDSSGYLQRLSVGTVSTVYTFTGSDSYINAADENDDISYIGLANGKLYIYDGSTISLLRTFDNKITNIISIQGNVYVSIYLSTNIYMYDGSNWNTIEGIYE